MRFIKEEDEAFHSTKFEIQFHIPSALDYRSINSDALFGQDTGEQRVGNLLLSLFVHLLFYNDRNVRAANVWEQEHCQGQ